MTSRTNRLQDLRNRLGDTLYQELLDRFSEENVDKVWQYCLENDLADTYVEAMRQASANGWPVATGSSPPPSPARTSSSSVRSSSKAGKGFKCP